MTNISKQLDFFLKLNRVQGILAKTFDSRLTGGLGFNDFVILYYLSQAPDEKMRRIDLAEKISLSPSGITRMLPPMEKIGLIKRESSEGDARVSYVKLASGGKRLLEETIDRAEMLTEEFLPTTKLNGTKDISEIFSLLHMGTTIK